MKIIMKDAIYVQKNDIVFLNQTDLSIPASIFMKVYGKGVVIIDDSNRYDFIKFEEKSEIEFFENLDWIIEYNSMKDLSVDEIMALGQSIAQERNDLVDRYNKVPNAMKKKKANMIDECKQLEYKMYSVRDFLWFKQGYLSFKLPSEIDSETLSKLEEKGFQKILNIFRRK